MTEGLFDLTGKVALVTEPAVGWGSTLRVLSRVQAQTSPSPAATRAPSPPLQKRSARLAAKAFLPNSMCESMKVSRLQFLRSRYISGTSISS